MNIMDEDKNRLRMYSSEMKKKKKKIIHKTFFSIVGFCQKRVHVVLSFVSLYFML